MVRTYLLALLLAAIAAGSCQESSKSLLIHHYQPPSYKVEIIPADDTLRFPLTENTFNAIKSFNIFRSDTNTYLSLYDGRSEIISIYDFHSGNLIRQLKIEEIIKPESLNKTSVYSKNFDTIFIINKNAIFLADSAGTLKDTVLLQEVVEHSMPIFEGGRPPVFANGRIMTGRHARSVGTSFTTLKSWNLIYDIDLKTGKITKYYNLPDIYFKEYFGRSFLDYSYCYNNHNRFVFSFPADSNIYETDLSARHTAYNSKSRFHNNAIEPVPKAELIGKVETRLRSYLLRDSYGEIFFDPSKKRYLRVAKSKLTIPEYDAKIRSKKQRLMIFDENLRIIGESAFDANISLSGLLITPEGQVYARLNPRDEYAVNFIKLSYIESKTKVYLTNSHP